MTGPFVWSLWIDIVVGMSLAVVIVPVVFYLLHWPEAQRLRGGGLSRRTTFGVLWRSFEGDLIRRLEDWISRHTEEKR